MIILTAVWVLSRHRRRKLSLAAEFNGGQHLRVTDHRASYGRILDDVVLLNYRQDVAAEFSHLAVVLLDHFCAFGLAYAV